MMKNSKVFQSKKEYSCGDGKLHLNLFNGSYTYSYPLLSIGRNSYSISANLVFYSTYSPSDFGGRKIGFGNGWKLDIEQHLFPYGVTYNLNGFIVGDYVYIDANWHIHRFVFYKTTYEGYITTNYYYDESGTGLIVKKCGDSLIMEDEYFNQYIFANGRLVEIRSSINNDIRKIIEYNNNNQIISYYDNRKQNRFISFTYNNNNLISISNTLTNQSYSVIYDANRITELIVSNTQINKTVHQFLYNSETIEYIINSIDLETLKIDYNNYGELITISSGVLKQSIETEADDANMYCGDLVHAGENNYISNCGLRFKDVSYSMPIEYIKSVDQYTYNEAYTEVIDKAEINIRHSFDVDGRLLCSLEKKNQNDYYSLERPNDKVLSQVGQSLITFNGNEVNELNSVNNYSYLINRTDDNYPFINFLNSLIDSSDLHTLSFYIMFSNNNDNNRVINIDFSFENTSYDFTKETIISNVNAYSWQKVEIPINFERKQLYMTAIKISLNQAMNGSAYISDVMIKEGGAYGIFIDDLLNNIPKEIRVGTNFYLDSTLYTVSPSFYVTQNDLLATYKSLFLNSSNNNRYDFYCNNKTKIIGVFNSSIESFNSPNYSLQINTGIPNFHLTLADYIEIYRDQNNIPHTRYLIMEEQYRFHLDGNKAYYELKQSIGEVHDYSYNDRLADADAKISYYWENSDGTKRATKSIKSIDNTIINTVTHNFYDEFGNLTQIKTYDEDNLTGEYISNNYNYSSDKELLTSITENGVTSYIYYDALLNIDHIIAGSLKKMYKYDSFNQIESIDFINNNNSIKLSTNMIVKDKYERISVLKDTCGNSCGFLYNGINDICRLTVNNRINSIFKKKELNNNFYYKSKTYQDVDKIIDNTIIYDKYGNIISKNVDSDFITYTYENKDYSNYVKRIVQINDSINNDIINYNFDDEGTETKTINNEFEINKTNLYTEYNINTDLEKYTIMSDNYSTLKSGQIVLVNKSIQKLNNESSVINDYTFVYEADNLGRLSKVKSNKISELTSLINIDKTISYSLNTTLPNKIKYDIISEINNNLYNASFSFENEYCNGNITKFKEYGNSFIENPYCLNNVATSTLISKEYQYSYDEANRLTSEVIKLNDDPNNVTTFNYIYGNTSNMIECVTNNNVTTKEFVYSNGRMISYTTNNIKYDIEYDNYGNIVGIGNKTYSFNSQNKLSSIVDGEHNYSYFYNYEGIRYKKVVDNTIIKYHLDGIRIIGEDWYENNSLSITKKIRYFYDAEGICGLKYDGCYFKLIKDSLGNVNKVMYQGKIIGEYNYDAWGNVIVNPISIDSDPINGARDNFVLYNNPFRYKGYYYDNETGLYYLVSRYYYSKLYCYISADRIDYLEPRILNGLNLYCYCCNNPNKYIDSTGCFAISLTMLGLIIGAVIGATVGGVIAYNVARDSGAENWELFGWTMLGSLFGGIIGGALGAGVVALVTHTTGIIGLSITKYSIISIRATTILGTMDGYIGAATATGSGYYLISEKIWNGMTTAERWYNNSTYLRDANALGSQFSIFAERVPKIGSALWEEIQYLIEHNIPWSMF